MYFFKRRLIISRIAPRTLLRYGQGPVELFHVPGQFNSLYGVKYFGFGG